MSRRNTFNQLVLDINQFIRDAVDDAAKSGKINYKVGYTGWDDWVSTALDARMCSPSSNGDYPDPKQPDMHFIKTTSMSSTPAAAIAPGHGPKFLTADARAGTRGPVDGIRLRVPASPPGIMVEKLFGLI